MVAVASLAFVGSDAASANLRRRPGTNILVFGGALVGVLHVVPASDCGPARPHGVALNIGGRLRGSASTEWEIQVLTPRKGTFTVPEGEKAGIVVSSSPQDEGCGSNSAGTISVSGARGSADVELWSTDAGKIQLAGKWSCAATRAKQNADR